jgi:hypothetical protein
MDPLSDPLWNTQAGIPPFLEISFVDDFENTGLFFEETPDRIFAETPELREFTDGAMPLKGHNAYARDRRRKERPVSPALAHLSLALVDYLA